MLLVWHYCMAIVGKGGEDRLGFAILLGGISVMMAAVGLATGVIRGHTDEYIFPVDTTVADFRNTRLKTKGE